MKKIAVLIDGGFLAKKLVTDADPELQAERIVRVAKACVVPSDEDLYRIFYYDCEPFGGKRTDLLGNTIDFRTTPRYTYQRSLLAALGRQEYVAVRRGDISCRGWVLKPNVEAAIRVNPNTHRALTPADFTTKFQQKGVDMRIGLDVALLAIDHLVDRIALVTADSDFIPAMKLARREGLQVALISMANKAKPALLHHADFYRNPNVPGDIRPPRRVLARTIP